MMPAREARRVLQRLVRGSRLVRKDTGDYAITGMDGRRSRPAAAALVETLIANGWLREESGALAVTAAGVEWVSRFDGAENPYAAQHQVLDTRRITDDEGRECYVVVNLAESPLGWMQQRGLIDQVQFEAGERLRRDFTLAQLTPRMGIDLTAPVGRRSSRPAMITDTALAAKQRFNRAMRAVGPGLSDVLFDICCQLRGLEESERARAWPRASAKVVLRIALDRLAAHYGMGVRRSSPIRAWSKEEAAG